MKLRKIWIFAVAVGAPLLFTGYANITISQMDSRTTSRLEEVPYHRVGLVFGCAPTLKTGQANPFFTNRIQAAAELFRAGKVSYLLVSGDNHREGYDEPTAMREALIRAGIPQDKIVCDYAGFSTLDSVIRVREVFQQTQITMVSQKFHNARAIYFAQAHGIEACGYNAPDVRLRWGLKTYLREILSRAKAVASVRILHAGPKFLGAPILIGAGSQASG